MNISLPLHVANDIKHFFDDDSPQHISISRAKNMQADTVNVDIASLTVEQLDELHQMAKAAKLRGIMMQVSSLRSIKSNPSKATVSNLKTLVPGLVSFFLNGVIDGWVYRKTDGDLFVPWLVTDIYYKDKTMHVDASVVVRLLSNVSQDAGRRNTDGDRSFSSITISSSDIVKRTIPEILAAEGFYHETPEFKAAYESDLSAFCNFRPQFGSQFLCSGVMQTESGNRAFNFYGQHKTVKVSNARLVNDETEITRKVIDAADRSFWDCHDGGAGSCFTQLPYHPFLYMFDLTRHEHVWVHASFLQPYQYKPELRDKIILPVSHRDLIDALTTDLAIMEDIIEGKSGGTTILCVGKPGLGKTLTAEVYSEVIQKPLYRVHSGQLGISPDHVGARLQAILQRAERWGAVLLIDEADVFIRARGNDIGHNAVVAEFLRTLEYFSGLLFLTTNRDADIDDAIRSRCIATIAYQHPGQSDASKIWRVLSEQFGLSLSDELITELTSAFPKLSGRDIKELLKLTSRFAKQANIPLTLDAFRRCAVFRGIEINTGNNEVQHG